MCRDLFGWEWTDERFGEYIVERIRQLVLVGISDFRLVITVDALLISWIR